MQLIRRVTKNSMSHKSNQARDSRPPRQPKSDTSSNQEQVTLPTGAICIDGSQLEGGGQILRNSVALAAITGQPIYVDKIRAGRKNPGLSPQHLTGLELVEAIAHGKLHGGAVRSTAITFVPGTTAAGTYTADTKTAGSCTLMVQQALPALLFVKQPAQSAPTMLTLRGGTDASFAPPIGYLQHVLLPLLQQRLGPAGKSLELRLVRRGFYPRGGGEAVLQVCSLAPGDTLPSITLTQRGHLTRIDGYAFTAGRVRPDVGWRMAKSATEDIKQALEKQATIYGSHVQAAAAAAAARTDAVKLTADREPLQQGVANNSTSSSSVIPSVVVDIGTIEEPPQRAVGDGGGIVLVATTSTGCLLGATAPAERGVTAEAVGAMAARDLIEVLQSGAAVDDWMQDQLVIFMALAEGSSCMLCNEPTLHTRTAISVVQQLLPQVQFAITMLPPAAPQLQPLYLIKCKGAGMHR